MSAPALSLAGLLAFVSFGTTALLERSGPPGAMLHTTDIAKEGVVEFLAVGDINLGRRVGQQILGGDTTFPFVFAMDTFLNYDVVFGNLESPLSDQGGETQHPRNNLVFTGPPAGGHSLKLGGLTVVSTANNHALDYGLKGLRETMMNLDSAGIAYSGTAIAESLLARPVIVQKNGIRLAFFCCTDLMNMEDERWKRNVTPADTAMLLPQIRRTRATSDFIIVSYHGGGEYSSEPSQRTILFARQMLDGGADLFIGHHPHVPQAIEEYQGKVIVYSLGNFVFRQPFDYWTQRSFAFAGTIVREDGRTLMTNMRCLPLLAGDQPRFLGEGEEANGILERIGSLSLALGKEVAWLE